MPLMTMLSNFENNKPLNYVWKINIYISKRLVAPENVTLSLAVVKVCLHVQDFVADII